MFYIMNTKTKTPTATPWDNEFGHCGDNVSFMFIQSGTSVKAVATYGTAPTAIGSTIAVTQDTGMGHRWMAPHTLIAVATKDGMIGTPPAAKNIPFWVCK